MRLLTKTDSLFLKMLKKKKNANSEYYVNFSSLSYSSAVQNGSAGERFVQV